MAERQGDTEKENMEEEGMNDICFFDTLAAGYFIMGFVTCIVFGMALYIFYLFDRREKARQRNKTRRMFREFHRQATYDAVYKKTKRRNK